jgi:HSP20 family protein
VTTLMMRERPFMDLVDWLEGEFPALPVFRPLIGAHTVRVEDYVDDGHYVLRAELPGIDPEKDVNITIENDVLTIKAERRDEKKDGHRSEFRYGAVARSISLPGGVDEDDVTAKYTGGILEVRIGIKPEVKPEPKHISIMKS